MNDIPSNQIGDIKNEISLLRIHIITGIKMQASIFLKSSLALHRKLKLLSFVRDSE
jgi:hypothetical protein